MTTKADFLNKMADRGLQGVECDNIRNDGVEYCSWVQSSSDNQESADFYNDRLSRYAYYFDHDDWESFSDAFTEKYGSPSSTHQTRYQNMMGAVVMGKTMMWQRGHSYLMVREYASKLTQSNIVLVDEKLDAVVQKLEREAEAQDHKRLIE